MKSLVIGAALVIGVAATSEAKTKTYDCKEGRQHLFLEIGSGDELHRVLRTCVNGSYYGPVAPVQVIPCREGERVVFDNYEAGDTPVREIRTCVEGRFYPYQPQPEALKCVEGTEELMVDKSSGDSPRVWKVCRSGIWKNLF